VTAVATEGYLVRRVLDALLREDYRGVASRATAARLPQLDDGRWLRVTLDGAELLIPVSRGRFLADWTARRPGVARHTAAGPVLITGLEDVLEVFRPVGDADEEAGFTAFVDECRQTLTGLRLGESRRPGVLARLRACAGYGLSGSLAYEALAAHRDHPVYPTARCRLGICADDLERYAPEFAPTFTLRWVALPVDATVLRGEPESWPTFAQLGLPGALAATHVPFPVHPLTFGTPLDAALRATGLAECAVRAERPYLQVTPTLSVRTVALTGRPCLHIKLPLPTSTLGTRNRRSVKPGTLTDGDLVQRLLGRIVAGEPALAGRVLLADEATYGHAGNEYLGYLVRRYPAGLDGARVVPVAALLADGPDGRPVVAELAEEFFAGDVGACFDAYLTVLFGVHTVLWLRHGIALEAHQQNTSLVLDRGGVRLLYKDNDGARIDPALADGDLSAVDDPRLLVSDPRELADVFTTITVHLCAGALAFGLAERGLVPLDSALRLVRRRLEDSLAGLAGARDAALFRARVLDADRLPVKSMVIAGTLRSKQRTGAADINKYYGTTGPNYLRASAHASVKGLL